MVLCSTWASGIRTAEGMERAVPSQLIRVARAGAEIGNRKVHRVRSLNSTGRPNAGALKSDQL